MGMQWVPDSDAHNAPQGALLLATNLVPDGQGSIGLRRGSSKLYDSLPGGNLTAIHAVELADGTTYMAASVGDRVYINGNNQGDFTGTGDIAMGDDAYQMFFARGTTKKKWDGSHWNNWGIAKPSSPPTLAAVNTVTKSVSTFASGESPAPSVIEGTGSLGTEADQTGAANQASKLIPDGQTWRAVYQKLWSSDQDYFTISGVDGTETDLFDLFINGQNPANIETIQIVFGLDNSSTVPFVNDRLEFTFDVRNKKQIPVKDETSEGYAAFESAVLSSLAAVRPQDVTGIKTPEQVKAILASVGHVPSTTSVSPADANSWSHLTVSRGQFKRIGNTTNRGWDTVRGFKIVYTVRAGTTSTLSVSDAIIVGGGGRTLTGTYRCVIRGARKFSQYYELSPPSDQSEPINLNHQTLQVTIPGSVLSGLDPQCDQVWVYLFGGWLDAYYRFAVVPSHVRGGFVLDDLSPPSGGDANSANERSRLPQWGMPIDHTVSSDLILTILRSETDILTENERLEPYLMEPPDNIVAVAGPHHGRMYTLTEDGYVYPSTLKSPGTFNSVQVLDLTRFGNPMWMVRTGQGITVGMEKDVIFIGGSGDDQEDGTVDLYAVPYNVGNPPVDAARWVDGNAIIYRSSDGLMLLTGQNLQPIPMAGTGLLWRGFTRHGVAGLNVTGGRFRLCVDDLMLYVLAPEGTATADNIIYRYSTALQQWSRLYYPQVGAFYSLSKKADGTLMAGDDAGNLWALDVGLQDGSSDIPVVLLTPNTDGGAGYSRKDPLDWQIHADTGGTTGTLTLLPDSNTTSTTYDFNNPGDSVYRVDVSDSPAFVHLQIQLSGNFSTFVGKSMNLTFRPRPQHSVHLDTGYILPDDPGDMVWLYEVEFDAIAESTVTMKLYLADRLDSSYTITPTTSVRKPYIVPMPRGKKGKRPRLVFQCANGEGSIGFDCYQVRLRMSTSGNQEGASYRTAYPTGSLP